MSVGQLQKATEILLYVVLYQARSCYISQEKQVGYELYSFLDQVALKTKKTKSFGLCLLEPHQRSALDPKKPLKLVLNHVFHYDTEPSSTKWTLDKLLG